MHIDTIPNRNSRPAYLLRESVRDGTRVRKRTLANLSSLPIEQIEAIRRVLKGEKLGPVEDGLEVVRSRAHGHVEAVLTAMRRLGLERLVDAKASRERTLVVAMVAERILAPEASKLGMTRAWADTTLPNARHRRRRRGWALCGHGLARRAPGDDRDAARQAAP